MSLYGLERTRTLLHAIVNRHGGETTEDLGDNVGSGGIRGDAAVVEGHDGHGWVEVSATDGSTEENDDGESGSNHPPGAGGDDDGQKNEGSQEFNEDGEDVHSVCLMRGFLDSQKVVWMLGLKEERVFATH